MVLFSDDTTDLNIRDNDGMTFLHELTSKGYYGILDEVVASPRKSDVNINLGDCCNRTALHWAAIRDYGGLASKLIAGLGASLTAEDDNGETALHTAASNSHEGTLREFTAYVRVKSERDGINLDVLDRKNNQGNTALHLASRSANVLTVEELVKAGANVTIQNNKGRTALRMAVSSRREWISMALLKDDRLKEDHQSNAILLLQSTTTFKDDSTLRDKLIHWAVERGYADVMKELLSQCGDAVLGRLKSGTSEFVDTLDTALQQGYDELVSVLVDYYIAAKKQVGPRDEEPTALHLAVRSEKEH